MARKNGISRLVVPPPPLLFLLLLGTTQREARALKQSKKNSLLNALFKLNFIRTVEPTYLPPPTNPSSNGDAASLAAADSGDGTNPPFCVNPPNSPSIPPFTSTPSTPFIPDQPPPLPPISPTPPSFEPSPSESSTPSPSPPTTSTPNPPESVPSPIFVVPSPPEFGPGGPGGLGGGFLPPIVYPPPLAPPLPPGAGQALWCVAKPTVPDPIIQESMDYACGSGAECKSIQPSGACYRPNTVLAHASYAFNSYCQMTKASGGTCDFGGTATIVTRDPSYEKCEFNLL